VEGLVRVRIQMMVGLAILLSAGTQGAVLRAQPAAGDAEWLSHCQRDDWGRSNRAHVCEIRVERLPRPTTLTVDGGENGGVTIMGWDGDSVVMHALVRANGNSPDEARDLASRVTISFSNGRIHADGPEFGHHEWWSVSYRVYVPRHTDLAIETLNGPVSVENVTGHMNMRAVNGPVSLRQVGGDVHARAQNGPIDVALEGARWDGAGLDAESENGPVELSLPASYAAHLETGTENGPMDVRFPITLQGDLDTRHLSLDIGGGGPPIRLITTNGPVTLRHTSD
jgi:DUF4097 and DUF4098 domain-containing protein YvlB